MACKQGRSGRGGGGRGQRLHRVLQLKQKRTLKFVPRPCALYSEVSPSLCLSVCLSVSSPRSLRLSRGLFLAVCQSCLCLCLCLSLSVCICVCVCVYVCFCFCVVVHSMCVRACLCFHVCLRVSCVSGLSTCLSQFVCVCTARWSAYTPSHSNPSHFVRPCIVRHATSNPPPPAVNCSRCKR
jgi:hypothetical protein